MSKMNAVRFINVNYNNNAIKVSDECFHFHGKSTLLSLRNGGGKSVLVQMMTAPFVHRNKQNVKDRPFAGYFTSEKPSFILVEWLLDDAAGYVLTGLMVRKSQEISEEQRDSLEMVGIVSEYQKPCPQDIDHLPVIERGKKKMTLKSYAQCKELFASYKKDGDKKFFCYDLGSPAQSRQYFHKLSEYRINGKEWENIIRKINENESGLSELFADCRDERGLVEKWFLKTVEKKLDKSESRTKNFQKMVGKYAEKYKGIQTQRKRRDTILEFKEAVSVLEDCVRDSQNAEEEKQKQEGKIAQFIHDLSAFRDKAEESLSQMLHQKEALAARRDFLNYAEISRKFHECEDQLTYHTGNQNMLVMERESLEREEEGLQEKLHLLACARQQSLVDDNQKDWEILAQKLELARKKDENLEPERAQIGYALRCYYEGERAKTEKEQKNLLAQRKEVETSADKYRQDLKGYRQELEDILLKRGSLQSLTERYDEEEKRYNASYEENFCRNMLGSYEPGTLEIAQEAYEKECASSRQEKRQLKESLVELQSAQHAAERLLEEKNKASVYKEVALSACEETQKRYEAELAERRDILQYLEMEKEQIFCREAILETAERKLAQIAERRKILERAQEALQGESRKLASGRVLELPEEIAQEFDRLGIHIVYGMEWLKKNGCPNKEKEALVRRNPFLPYALLLSEREMQKISENAGEIYTSLPIPIVKREDVEKIVLEKDGNLVLFPQIHFYLFFNENLLDDKKLEEMLEKNKKEMTALTEKIQVCRAEYESYFQKKEKIKAQKVTRELVEKAKKEGERLFLERRQIAEEIRRCMADVTQKKEDLEEIRRQIFATKQRIEHQEVRQQDFQKLQEVYAAYEQNRTKLLECQKKQEQLETRQQLAEEQIAKLSAQRESLRIREGSLARQAESLAADCRRFAKYTSKNMDKSETANFHLENAREAAALEARYEAITSQLNRELAEVEEDYEKACARYEESKKTLAYLQKKYDLKENAWAHTIYDQEEEEHQEALLAKCLKKKKAKEREEIEEQTKIAVLQSKKEALAQAIRTECKKEEPLPKEKIQEEDLAAQKNQIIHQMRELDAQVEALKKRAASYDENLTALAAYSDLSVTGEETAEEIDAMNAEELRAFQGILLRDYRACEQQLRDCQEALSKALQEMLRRKNFQDAFYKNPLENMLRVCKDADEVAVQLKTTIDSYDSLLKQLMVDISVVEREKESLVELLEDYVLEIHKNLKQIDKNSTITIRERPVKMLRIKLPSWEENEGLYVQRLRDFVDEITKESVERFEKNEYAQEYIGMKMTTANLYDCVVGIGNVQIGLYKVEAQREYPITWSQAAANSGGEGFLSAFVILASLLSYLRRDEADLFDDNKEGKVLLMDNPFAKTHSAHLLRPLMDMAEKTNTQLICLSGIGNDAIYSCFDNIYVLNLIAASLRSGVSYLSGEQKRGGEDAETLLSSQIEVGTAEELLF